MVTAATTTTAVTSSGKSSSLTEQQPQPPKQQPFHLLMVTDYDGDAEQRVRLEHPKLRRDYLSQRYLAMESLKEYHHQQQQQQQQQQALARSKKNGNNKTPVTATVTVTTTTPPAAVHAVTTLLPKEKHPFWSGASDVERSLVSCCQIPTKHEQQSDFDDDFHPLSHHRGVLLTTLKDRECDDFIQRGGSALTQGRPASEYYELATTTVPGALEHDKILHFVGLVAVKCTDLGARALALAILERSWEADQAANVIMMNKKGEQEEAEDGTTTAVDDNESSSSPARKRLRRNDDNDEKQPANKKKGQTTATTTRTMTQTQPSQSDCLVMSFLMAGGLRILNQWLIEALTPVPTSSSPPPLKSSPSSASSSTYSAALVDRIANSAAINTRNASSNATLATTAMSSMTGSLSTTTASTATTNKPSPFGPLLLPLLSFLAHMPFDQDLVKQSKINKRIRQLSKDVDAIVHQAQQQIQQQQQQQQANSNSFANVVGGKVALSYTMIETLTDPRTGGLSVLKVQEAVNTLKRTWVEKQKASTTARAPTLPTNPFQSLKDSLQQRLREVQEFESGAGPEPSWMVAAEAACKAAAAAAAAKAAASTCPVKRKKHETRMAEMARLERERERDERRKGDIRKFKEERDKVLAALHQAQRQQEAQKQLAAHKSESRKRVRWSDGLGAASLQRKRDQLEEVFVFTKDQSDPSLLLSSPPHNQTEEDSRTMENDNTETDSNSPSTTDTMDETQSEEVSTENASATEEDNQNEEEDTQEDLL